MRNNGTVTRSTVRVVRLDSVCAQAADVARAALVEAVDPAEVGEYLQAVAEGERLVTHLFDCQLAGYRGWRWAVTVTRVSRSRQVTVCETVLLPGPDALLAPGWLPWHDRLQPGDLGVGDLMPTSFDDDRLAPGYLQSDDPAVEEVSWEFGLGRSRVMSREGRAETAQRWYDGDHGPQAPISTAAPTAARCGTCGFYLMLAGALRQAFGACGNVYAPDDGRVVSVDHGCGAHSETLAGAVETPVDELPTIYDDGELEAVTVNQASSSPEA
ncbi:DUF3027 domain-containing protein [Micromonospora sp. NBC_01813]|uniref:DUF3027 domain-containing protein n=1 Tax=Micromonospora sp. NBC_01813 TaxID=2975988 RepID=UPI002DDBAE44|nr:DUF3027 domain-containing protein [Micromonospora sp. NBC_01813]WSA12834.1 DUF3027 domain-containing protein [Micromonospora sp. NBC_01813]